MWLLFEFPGANKPGKRYFPVVGLKTDAVGKVCYSLSLIDAVVIAKRIAIEEYILSN